MGAQDHPGVSSQGKAALLIPSIAEITREQETTAWTSPQCSSRKAHWLYPEGPPEAQDRRGPKGAGTLETAGGSSRPTAPGYQTAWGRLGPPVGTGKASELDTQPPEFFGVTSSSAPISFPILLAGWPIFSQHCNQRPCSHGCGGRVCHHTASPWGVRPWAQVCGRRQGPPSEHGGGQRGGARAPPSSQTLTWFCLSTDTCFCRLMFSSSSSE